MPARRGAAASRTEPKGIGAEGKFWRRDPESNWGRRICNPLHGHYAIAPKSGSKRGKASFPPLNLERETRLALGA